MCQSFYRLENRAAVWVVGSICSSLLCLEEIEQESKPSYPYNTDQNLTANFRSSLVIVIQTGRILFKSCRVAYNFSLDWKTKKQSKFSSVFALRLVFIYIQKYLIFIRVVITY